VIPASSLLIESAIKVDPMISKRSVDVQLAKLVIEHIQYLHLTGFNFKASPLVIIIDGLDECQGKDIQSEFVKSLAAAFHELFCKLLNSPKEYFLISSSCRNVNPSLRR